MASGLKNGCPVFSAAHAGSSEQNHLSSSCQLLLNTMPNMAAVSYGLPTCDLTASMNDASSASGNSTAAYSLDSTMDFSSGVIWTPPGIASITFMPSITATWPHRPEVNSLVAALIKVFSFVNNNFIYATLSSNVLTL